MSKNQEKRYSRVSEGIYRYINGGFHLRYKVGGKSKWHKLKSPDLAGAKREARDVLRTGEHVNRRQSARTVAEFSQEELSSDGNAAATTLKKKKGYHAKILSHWPDGANTTIGRAKREDVEKCINDAVGQCSASYRNQFIQYLKRVFERALAARAIAAIPGVEPGVRKRETVWRLGRVLPVASPIPTVEQWRNVVKTIRGRKLSDTRDEAADVVEAFALLGLGQAEVASLRSQDVDFETQTLRVTRRKTGVSFTVPLNTAALRLLKRRREIIREAVEQPLFTVYSPKKAIQSACADLGYPAFTPRSFRKLYVTQALRAGVNVKTIAAMQGHQDGGKLILRTYSAEVNADELALAGLKMSQAFDLKGQPKRRVSPKRRVKPHGSSHFNAAPRGH